MDLRTQALIRYAQKTHADDPVGYLEGLLFSQIDEIIESGRVIETAVGGKLVKFQFLKGEAPGEIIMSAINYLETITDTGVTPSNMHQADFRQIDL